MRLLLSIVVDGKKKMIAKAMVANGVRIVYHQCQRIRWFRKLDSPYGVDTALLSWMEKMDIPEFHHYSLQEGILCIAKTQDLLDYGIVVKLDETGRDLVHLPRQMWKIEVPDRRYHVPWIEDEFTLPDMDVVYEDDNLLVQGDLRHENDQKRVRVPEFHETR